MGIEMRDMQVSAIQLSPLYYVTKHPISALRRLGFVALGAFLIGTIIPGIICYFAGVFSRSQLEETLKRQPAKFPQLLFNVERVGQLKGLVKRLDEALSNEQTDTLRNVSEVLKSREYLVSQASQIEQETAIVPFFLSPNMLLWTAIYTSLGSLVYVVGPKVKPSELSYRLWQSYAVVAPIYAVYESNVWFRNFVLRSEGRTVYVFANWDVSPAGYLIQEFNIVLVFVLLAIVWHKWLNYFALCRDNQKAKVPLRPNVARLLGELFLHWQVSSIVLAFGFIYFTGAYWDLVVSKNDHRYIFPAIAIHCIWGLSWIILSLPVLTTWYAWHSGRQSALLTLYNSPDEHSEIRLKVIQEIAPVAFWNAVTSGVAAMTSFLIPILKPLFGWG